MRSIAKLGIGAAALLAGLATADIAAAQSYPRLIGSGDEAVVDYGPGPRNNIAGGGRVALGHDGDTIAVRRLDSGFTQDVPRNQVATPRNENGSLELRLVPVAPAAPSMTAGRAGSPRG